MPYDKKLAERVRAVFDSEHNYTEKEMFGSLYFMVGRNMAVGVTGNDLIVRPGPINLIAALALPHVRPLDFTGRPMEGFVCVEPKGLVTDTSLAAWVERGAAYARSLPAK